MIKRGTEVRFGSLKVGDKFIIPRTGGVVWTKSSRTYYNSEDTKLMSCHMDDEDTVIVESIYEDLIKVNTFKSEIDNLTNQIDKLDSIITHTYETDWSDSHAMSIRYLCGKRDALIDVRNELYKFIDEYSNNFESEVVGNENC